MPAKLLVLLTFHKNIHVNQVVWLLWQHFPVTSGSVSPLYSPGQWLLPSLPLLLLHELGLQLNVFCSQCLVGFSQFYHRVRESICVLLAFMKLGLQLCTDTLMVREELLDVHLCIWRRKSTAPSSIRTIFYACNFLKLHDNNS